MKTADCYKCKFLKRSKYFAGETGKLGPESWYTCRLKDMPIRAIKKCKDYREWQKGLAEFIRNQEGLNPDFQKTVDRLFLDDNPFGLEK
jgi:hypothetical protein